MKYCKKPVVINAWPCSFEMFKDNNIPQWLREAIEYGVIYIEGEAFTRPAMVYIKTLEGDHHARIGDMIIQGVQGELYPCKPHIFEKTYEAVEL